MWAGHEIFKKYSLKFLISGWSNHTHMRCPLVWGLFSPASVWLAQPHSNQEKVNFTVSRASDSIPLTLPSPYLSFHSVSFNSWISDKVVLLSVPDPVLFHSSKNPHIFPSLFVTCSFQWGTASVRKICCQSGFMNVSGCELVSSTTVDWVHGWGWLWGVLLEVQGELGESGTVKGAC